MEGRRNISRGNYQFYDTERRRGSFIAKLDHWNVLLKDQLNVHQVIRVYLFFNILTCDF